MLEEFDYDLAEEDNSSSMILVGHGECVWGFKTDTQNSQDRHSPMWLLHLDSGWAPDQYPNSMSTFVFLSRLYSSVWLVDILALLQPLKSYQYCFNWFYPCSFTEFNQVLSSTRFIQYAWKIEESRCGGNVLTSYCIDIINHLVLIIRSLKLDCWSVLQR